MYFLLEKNPITGQFHWSLKAANGETLADSNQGYNRRRDARIAIELIQTQASGAQILEAAADRKRKAIPPRRQESRDEEAGEAPPPEARPAGATGDLSAPSSDQPGELAA